jgi:hypothetical protein
MTRWYFTIYCLLHSTQFLFCFVSHYLFIVVSSPFSFEVKKVWSYTSTPSYIVMAWCLIKHGDRFYLYFCHLASVIRLSVVLQCFCSAFLVGGC